jgi:hypothetical protein
MAKDKLKVINKFYGGITRDDKSKILGVASNVEEVDIFSNADFIQAEQIFTADTLPAGTEAYAYTSDNLGQAWAYGKKTSDSTVRLMSVAVGGANSPGSWSTQFTSSDTTNLAYKPSPIQFLKTTEASNLYLYYLTLNGTTVLLKRYNIGTVTESTVGTMDGLSGTFDLCSMRVLFGELYIMNGKYIAKVDQDGVFTQHAFTLPNEWNAVDIIPVSDVSVILARYIDRSVNFSKGFWWDLTSTSQFDDSFDIPSGGPQWIVNHKETVKICCAANGYVRFFQMSGAFAGAVPIELPGIVLTNAQADATLQQVSPQKCLAVKDKILYFGLYKTDKSGIYALGNLDYDKPTALTLSKRFNTTDYSLHAPTALMIQGPNFYAAYSDNGTASVARCATNNSPSRSSNGIYESIWIDDDNPSSDKSMSDVIVVSYPLPASTDVNTYVAHDYGSYAEIFRADGTSMNTTSSLVGRFKSTSSSNKKSFKIKIQLVSNGTSSPKVTAIMAKMIAQDTPASKP